MNKLPLTTDSVIKAIKQAKAAWIDSVLKRELPGRIYAQVHSEDSAVRKNGLAWVKERGYSHEQDGEMVIVKKGFTVIAQTRLMLEMEKPEDLRAIAKVAHIRQNGEK